MRWPASRRAAARPGEAIQPRGLGGKRRLVVIAGVSVALLACVAGAASAGVFTGRGTAAASSVERGQSPARARKDSARSDNARSDSARSDSARNNSARNNSARSGTHRPDGRTAAAGRTSCASVAHIGDSTSVGMVSPQVLPDAAQRLAAQYHDAGVQHVLINASGGRSIVEQLPGQLNGYRLATDWYQAGYRGCWVFALGTNDTANVSVGSPVGIAARIQEMMWAAHGEPVMWVNVQTDLSSGPWSQANMKLWNNALVAACAAYPNMRILNWAAMVRPGWHLDDGIHYTAAGYAIRAHAIARALASAFPANPHHNSCVVS
ncbi:MAG TPA: GDSL-type esterase/lipase family protein [Streptosporangiaceae bacterium]|nr:GDSL-type esterase/lipase family protein [Streptosporangiaceae bacterium]